MWVSSLMEDEISNYLLVAYIHKIKSDVKDKSEDNSDSEMVESDKEKVKYIQKIFSDETRLQKKFVFSVERYRNEYNREENLEITVEYIVGEVYFGEFDLEEVVKIKTNLIDLSRDLLELRRYGVVLKRKDFNEICRIIEDRYLVIEPRIIAYNIKKVVCEIYKSYACEYYVQKDKTEDNTNNKNNADNKENTKETENAKKIENEKYYNIPVTEFREFTDEYYEQYKYSDIRKCLSVLTVEDIKKNYKFEETFMKDCEDKKVTKCSYGRTDNTVLSQNGKRIKVISFEKEILDELKDKLNDEKQ